VTDLRSHRDSAAPMKCASSAFAAACTRKMSSASTGLNAAPLKYGFCAATLSVFANRSPVVA